MPPTQLRRPAILWSPVWGLAAMQGAITLMWVVYTAYLPEFLGTFGLPLQAVAVLLVVENVLSAVTEPLMGHFSDRAQRWVGTRLPFIIVGVILAAALFLAIPAVVVAGGRLGLALRGLLILLLIAWALSMTIFRSPVLSLLGRYAVATRLPLATSILTLVGALASAIAPLANQAMLQLGAPLTFTLGSLVLLSAALYLRRMVPPAPLSSQAATRSGGAGLRSRNLILVFLAGMGITLGFRLLLFALPLALPTAEPTLGRWILLLFFGAIAVSALPMGVVATRLGTVRALLLGLGGLTLAALLLLSATALWGLMFGIAVAAGVTFSLVSNCTLPFALSLVPAARAALGTGLFFGGGALGSSLFFSLFQAPTLQTGAGFGAIAFLFAALCVGLCRPLSPELGVPPPISDAAP